MIVKVYYNKNLNMSPGKLSAQVAHVVLRLQSELNLTHHPHKIIILEARQGKLKNLAEQECCVAQYDLGYTEVESGTLTAIAYVEEGT